jgi:ADP-ribose pyrophosphatase YjhB (NUDIX family)
VFGAERAGAERRGAFRTPRRRILPNQEASVTTAPESIGVVATTPLDPGRPDFCARCATRLVEEGRGGLPRPVCPRCGWVYYARNATGAALLMERDGRVLLVRRAHEPFQGWWMLPAGFVEYGERAEETVVREAAEEAGLQVRLNGLFGVYFGADDPRNVAHLIVYRALAEGEPRAGDDAAEVAFFAADALPERIAFQSQRDALRDWAAGGRQDADCGAAFKALVGAIQRQDWGRLAALLDPDVRYVPHGQAPAFIKSVVGRDAYLDQFRWLWSLPGAHLDPLGTLVDGPRAAVRWRAEWPVRGRRTRRDGATVMQFRDGRLVQEDEYFAHSERGVSRR